MTQPLVSVIIPSFNRQNSIAKALESVLLQSYKNLEIIVADNRSTDNTPKILEEYRMKDSRIKIIVNEENLPLANTLNKAIATSHGSYIARLDDDDAWIGADKITKQIDFLESHKEHVLIGTGVIAVNEHGKEIRRTLFPKEHEQIRDSMLLRCLFVHPTVVFRKDAFVAAGGYSETLVCEDYDLWLRLGKIGKMYNIPEYLVYYQEGGKKLSRLKWKKILRCNIYLIKKYRKDYPRFAKAMTLSVLYYMYFSLPFNQALLPLFSKIKKVLFGSAAKTVETSR
jgi:glycosyltransferase involved in cell wall biosynthesis